MSYFSTIATRRIVLASKASLAKAPRQFSTTITAQKSATETVKDSLKTVDRKVSDKLVEGINAGAAAAEKVKEVTKGTTESSMNSTKATAEELRDQAKGKASELKGEAKGAAKKAEGKINGSL